MCHGTAPPLLNPIGFLATRDLSQPGISCSLVDLDELKLGVRVARFVFRALEIVDPLIP